MNSVLVSVLFLQAVLCFTVNSRKCNLPPKVLCSSEDVAEYCGETEFCEKVTWKADNEKVNFILYYESMCPGCRDMMLTQIYPTFLKIGEIMNITLVPYGNADETFNTTTGQWVFNCQHGPQECIGNMLETCALHANQVQPYAVLSFIRCMEENHIPNDTRAAVCAKKTGAPIKAILACAAPGSIGNYLEHIMAMKTNSLIPELWYVPWVTVNGVHTKAIQSAAETHLLQLICETYRGTNKPKACPTKVHKKHNRC